MKQILFIIGGSQNMRELLSDVVASMYVFPQKIDANFSDLIEPDMCAFGKCQRSTDLLVINHIGVNRIYLLSRVITCHIAVKRHGNSHFFINPDVCVICSDKVNRTDIVDNFPTNTYRVLDAPEVLYYITQNMQQWKP